jgi:ABC-2 type transport system ATP-binding protein
VAERVAIVDAGRVVVEGTPEQLKSELHGDAIQVELAAATPAALPALARVPGVREPVADGPRLRARADEGARAVPAVLAALEGAGVAVASVTVARPSLDDVYLRHVGRSFTAEEVAA